jgi:hypothetical protein
MTSRTRRRVSVVRFGIALFYTLKGLSDTLAADHPRSYRGERTARGPAIIGSPRVRSPRVADGAIVSGSEVASPAHAG